MEYPDRELPSGVDDVGAAPRELRRADDDDRARALSQQLPERGTDPTDVEMIDINERLKDLGYL